MNFQDLASSAQQTAQQGLETTKLATQGLVGNPVDTITNATSGSVSAVAQTAQNVAGEAQELAMNPQNILNEAEETVKHGIESVTGTVGNVVKEAEEAVKHGFESISNLVSGIFGGGKTEEEPKA